MSSLIPVLLVLSSLGLASASTGAAVPIGCWSGMFTPGNVVASDSNIVYQTNADCQQYCAGNSAGNGGPIPYSYFSQSGSTVTCSCATSEGNPNWTSTTPNTNLVCNAGEWSLSITQSTEVFQGCLTPQSFSAYTADPTYVDKGYFSQVEACFGQCRGYANVFVDPANDSAYGCACSNEVISAANSNVPADQCSGYNRMVYSHTPGDYVYGSTASSLTRRTNRERLQRKTKRKAFCPEGLTACNVGSNGGDAFECVDTSSELESCGGCTNGEFGSRRLRTGVDCTSLPGVALGGVTCSAGQCVVSACEHGLHIDEHGSCV